MKNLVIIIVVFFGFSLMKSQDIKANKKIDPQLIGTWKGQKSSKEIDNIDGKTKYWTTSLFENGNGVISFISFNDDGSIAQFAYNVEWWTIENRFYILFRSDNEIDEYEYMKKGDKVFYKSIKVYDEENSTYRFTETKILDHKKY